MQLDHIALSGASLADARTHVEEALGVALRPGGRHEKFGTHNALLGLDDGLYLEAIAIDPAAAAVPWPRWFDLDRRSGPPRLSNWICRTGDLEALCAALPDDFGAPVDLARDTLRWRMAVPADGVLPYDNCHPALIQWQTTPVPGDSLPASGCRLRRLTIRHPRAEALSAALAPHLMDDRLRYETGPAGLAADIATPHGDRLLA